MVPPQRLLDEAIPHWDVHERHAREVRAPVSMRTPIRGETSLRPDSVADFRRALPDGWVRIAMDVQLQPHGSGTTLRTETRVLATGPRSKRAFTLYWRLVGGGSSLIRHELLRAVARRAEADVARRG